MKELLSDVMKQASSLFENVIVTGTEDSTVVDGCDKDKMFYLVASVKTSIPEFTGEFGIGSLPLLNGLLNFASYKTDESKFIIHRKEHEGAEEVSEFEFRDRDGAKTKFKTISPRFIGDGKKTSIGKIPWDTTVSMTKAKASEIQQLAGLLTDVDKHFGLVVEDDKLFLTIGGKSEVTHATTIFLADGVTSTLLNSNKFYYNMTNFLAVIKRAENSACKVSFCSRGVVGITVETDHAVYNYYLRGNSN
jgi:hypothetical protein